MARSIITQKLPTREGLIAPEVVSRWLFTTRLSIAGSLLFTVAKVILGVMSASSFLIFNGLYNLGVAISKVFCLHGYVRGHDAQLLGGDAARLAIERRVYRMAGMIAALCGVVYAGHGASMVLFDVGINVSYSQVEGILIAALAFSEIGLGIAGLFSVHSKQEPALAGIKLVNMANALIAISLAQAALLSFAASYAPSSVDGAGACIFGLAAAAIGLFMMVHAPKAGA